MLTHFKTLDDLKEIILEYEKILLRPTRNLSHPKLYRRRDIGKSERMIKGIRVKDWFMSVDEKWVIPHDQMGLSFSSNYKNLKSVYKLKQRHNPSSKIHVFWVLEEADIPAGLKFMPDREKKGHYFLTVTEQMLLSVLVSKLKLIAQRMSIIRDGGEII
ncbi:hypothetical protein QWY82_05075 [Simiduia curdlanivorans]|uniref:Uncharacterized protein n=1 Tax=Simiduia curdlanivorans TaxID=1492769 RepID=A0ABV8V4Y0_9GAMM|nr:hypothetical protein [Simiduia curdlanivorans]MDN3638181.1 hypothetical protein [Simiduia curdlanivorans]